MFFGFTLMISCFPAVNIIMYTFLHSSRVSLLLHACNIVSFPLFSFLFSGIHCYIPSELNLEIQRPKCQKTILCNPARAPMTKSVSLRLLLAPISTEWVYLSHLNILNSLISLVNDS